MSRRTRKSRCADGLILGGLMLRRNKDCLLTSWRRQTKSYRRYHSNHIPQLLWNKSEAVRGLRLAGQCCRCDHWKRERTS